MSLTTQATNVVDAGGFGRQILYEACDPVTSTNDTETAPAAWQFDVGGFCILGATFVVTTSNMKINVYIANKSDFSDESAFFASGATINSGTNYRWMGPATGTNSPTSNGPIPWRYIRFKYQTASAGVNGTIALTFCAKNT